MAKKIVLFLSVPNPHGVESDYLCPDGSTVHVAGDWSSEAPLRYFLNTYSDVAEIISITTPRAEAETLPRLRALAKEYGKIQVASVPYGAGQDFGDQPLRDILSHFEKGDELLLDITGGMRDTVIYLLLLSQTLSYADCRRVGAVYSNLGERRIEDAESMLNLFELLDGMKELTAFGSVRTLRDYCAKLPPSQSGEQIQYLLDTAQELAEAVSLCRTGWIAPLMEEFDQALRDAETCADPLMGKLLDVFQEKFGRDMSVFGLIHWCMDNGMLQQALTIYVEYMPEKIFDRCLSGDVDAVKARVSERLHGFALQKYKQNPMAYLLNDGILKAVDWQGNMPEEKEKALQPVLDFCWEHRAELNRAETMEELEDLDLIPDPYYQEALENLLYLKRALYENGRQVDLSFKLPPEKNYLYDLLDELSYSPQLPQDDFIRWTLSRAMTFDNLNPYEKRVQTWCVALDHVGSALNAAGPYQIRVPYRVRDLRKVLRQYTYLKQVRNQISHAMDAEIMSDSYASRYFTRLHMPAPEEATAGFICELLRENLEQIAPESER